MHRQVDLLAFLANIIQHENFARKPKNITNTTRISIKGRTEMTENRDKHHIKELKEMIQEKKTEEPVEEVLVKFCARHGVSLDTCRIYYSSLVEKGEIKEK
jgi:ribosomal protein L20A (L18A)